MTLVHILSARDWRAAQASGEIRPDSLQREGFVHLSRPDQVLVPANRFYAGQTGLLLLYIDADALPDALVWEDTHGEGQAFPHLYAPLPVAAVVQALPFEAGADGQFMLPSIGGDPMSDTPPFVGAAQVPPRDRPSAYPEPFARRMAGRTKRVLGDRFGLKNFGVNLTELAPGASSALRHAHTTQDEFIYILEGTPLLHTDRGHDRLAPGDCAGFAAATGDAHRLVNDTDGPVVYLEIGDRTPGDRVTYPDDDLMAVLVDGTWQFRSKGDAV